MNKTLDTPYVYFELREGILIATYKAGVVVNLNAAKQIVADRIRFTDGRAMRVIIYVAGTATIELDAIDFIKSPEGVKAITAAAIIKDTPFASMISEFFNSVYHPRVIPVKSVDNEEQAMAWLKTFPE